MEKVKLSSDQLNELLRNNPTLAAANPELKRSVQQRAVVPIGDTGATAKLECVAGNGALAKSKVKKQNTARVLVRIVSIRRRLLDEDNLSEKAIVDCLRYSGCLRGDESSIAKIEVAQIKANNKQAEKIIVEIFEQI